MSPNYGVWLSLVERYVRDVEVAGSNPVTSTKKDSDFVIIRILFSFYKKKVNEYGWHYLNKWISCLNE